MTSKQLTAKDVQAALVELSEAERAQHSARYFKTAPGEYGAGDRFRGVPVPQQRAVARRFAELGLAEVSKLLASAWHEDRLCALFILVKQYERASKGRKADAARCAELFAFYLKHVDSVNNWDLVDSSAPHVVGHYLLSQPTAARTVLKQWLRAPSLWRRRCAVLATQAFIRAEQYELTLEFAQALLDDKEDLMHKAVGWMLREVGERDIKQLQAFLDQHQTSMPRTMLRYSIEKLPEPERKRRLAAK